MSDPEAEVVVTPTKNYVSHTLQLGVSGSSNADEESNSANISLPAVVGTGLSSTIGAAAVGVFALDNVAKKSLDKRWYVTYRKIGPSGQIYVGRCSGYGSSAEAVLQRYDATHRMNRYGYGPAQIDKQLKGSDVFLRIHWPWEFSELRTQKLLHIWQLEEGSNNYMISISSKVIRWAIR